MPDETTGPTPEEMGLKPEGPEVGTTKEPKSLDEGKPTAQKEIGTSGSGEKRDNETPRVIKTKEARMSIESGKSQEFFEFQLPTGEPIKVVFKGREETVGVDAFQENHVVIIGGEPQHLPREKYNQWQSNFTGRDGKPRIEGYLGPGRLAEFSKNGGLAIVVNQNPESLTETALLLGSQDPRVRELYHRARKFDYSQELLDIIDSGIAAKTLRAEESLFSDSHDGEALVLASFLGDNQASEKVKELKERYDESYMRDQERMRRAEGEWLENEPLIKRKENWIKNVSGL